MKNLEALFADASEQIILMGINPISSILASSARTLADLLTLRTNLHLEIYYESESENFNQSLILDHASASEPISYTSLMLQRNRVCGEAKHLGLDKEISELIRDPDVRADIARRITLRQVNLRLPLNIIAADNNLWFTFVGATMPSLSGYTQVKDGTELYEAVRNYIDFYRNPAYGGIFLSKPEEELIQLFDKQGFPRGIFPRACFYTTAYERFSVWGFVFNRCGEVLLQRRSMNTKDNRGLWDKSIGGHVGLQDSSSYNTAKRELVEELFLPEDERTKYVRAYLGDIVNFGDWNPKKRPERHFREALAALAPADWVMFRATNDNGKPLTVRRPSPRRLHDDEGRVTVKRTVFRSDVYLFIAPPSYLDSEEQMKHLVSLAEERGAASDHKLVSIGALRHWIERCESDGTAEETFTDDLIHVNLEYRPMLERFAEFVRFVS